MKGKVTKNIYAQTEIITRHGNSFRFSGGGKRQMERGEKPGKKVDKCVQMKLILRSYERA
jgi:hypothetical protein